MVLGLYALSFSCCINCSRACKLPGLNCHADDEGETGFITVAVFAGGAAVVATLFFAAGRFVNYCCLK